MIPKNHIRLILSKLIKNNWKSKLDEIEHQVVQLEKKIIPKKIRVLIGPSFSIYPPSFALDRLMSLALRLQGLELMPIYCDGLQKIECNYVGGDWSGGKSFEKNCENCSNTSVDLWHLSPNKPITLSKYLSLEDISIIKQIVSTLDLKSTLAYEQFGINFGKLAKDILVNNYLVGTLELIDEHEALLKVHLENLLMVSLSYERILDEKTPDRVVTNDSYYGMWAVLQHHCETRRIPFYSCWPVTNNRVAFAYNDAAMNLNFKTSWENFSKIKLTEADDLRINKWLRGDRALVIDTTKLSGHESHDQTIDIIDINSPTILLAANVIWDLAALNKQLIFKDMNEWIIQTIEWFRDKPAYQLIIKPHPVETSPQIPNTRETVATAIQLSGISIPVNVFLLRSDVKLTISNVITNYSVRGVVVHTTTVGFEYVANGIPVITTAKSPYRGFGFTVDPTSKAQYFQEMQNLLDKKEPSVDPKRINLARKFIKFYQFHYYSNLELFAGNPPVFSKKIVEQLSEPIGAFGDIVRSIVNGLPINSDTTWIQQS